MTQRMDRFLSGYAKSHREQVLFLWDDGSFETAEDGSGPDTIGNRHPAWRFWNGAGAAMSIPCRSRERKGRSGSGDRELSGHFWEIRSWSIQGQDGSALHGADGPAQREHCAGCGDGRSRRLEDHPAAATGHGVGMSQTAASALAGKGNSYAEILQYFYPGTELASGY